MLSTLPSLPLLAGIDSMLAAGRTPVDDRSDDSNGPAPAASERAATRILVVEDDWFAGTDMQAALQAAGYDVLEVATSADEAVQAAADYRPELVIMDVRLLGNRDGVDAALEIAKRFAIRSLFVSAYFDPALRSRAEAALPVGWLIKPITGEALVAAVNAALGHR